MIPLIYPPPLAQPGRITVENASMTPSEDRQVPIGKRHRTVRKSAMILYDYDRMVIGSEILPARRVFQPWQGAVAWRGQKVPITLGDINKKFDWGMDSGICCFLSWSDFFANCRLAEERDTLDKMTDLLAKLSGAPAPAEPAAPTVTGPTRGPNSRLLPASELFETDALGRTRLFYAAESGSLATAEKMIYRFPGTGFYPQRMGFIEKKDSQGFTAADVADQCGNEDVASLLRSELGRMEYYG